MFPFLLRRVLWLVPVMLVVAVTTFFLMYQAPGGPWDRQKPLPEATRRSLDAKFGLDKPLWVNPDAVRAERAAGEANPLALAGAALDSRFFAYLGGILRFDFGPSYQARGTETVQAIIRESFPASAKVGVVGLGFAVVVGIPLGIVGALKQNTWLDHGSVLVGTVGVSVPSFVTGVLLVILLSQRFGVSPLRRPEEWDGFGPAYLLPGVVLGIGTMAYIARLTRSSLLEVKRQDYVRTARAKGLSAAGVVRGHMLRNALIPVVTILGPAAAELVTGSIIIETIFGVPGLGREFVSSISARDYPMIMGTTLFYAALVAVANVGVDLAYGLIDPQIQVHA
ncbi:MAG: ABC transporter permease [Chloroflexia bacterium]|nr:ABC transporter permease [Chloroflexia bacterium]